MTPADIHPNRTYASPSGRRRIVLQVEKVGRKGLDLEVLSHEPGGWPHWWKMQRFLAWAEREVT